MLASEPARRWAAAAFAGLVAGALVGFGDAAVLIVTGAAGAPRFDLARVAALAGVVVAVAGALVAMLGPVASAAGARLGRRLGRSDGAGVALLVAVAAAPAAVVLGVALMAGRRARELAAWPAVSAAVALVLIAAAWAGARLVGAAVQAAHGGRTAPARGLSGAAAVAAVACVMANRAVLPRLYPWFHASLTVASLLAAVVAVALWQAAGSRPPTPRRWMAIALALLGGLAVSVPVVGRRQVLTYVFFEKTTVAGPIAGAWRRARGSSRAPAPRTSTSGGATAAVEPPLPEGPHAPDADVVLITIDALRADHVGAYGQPRPLTPHIDKLAAEGARFERAYTQAPHTSFAVASLLTGKYFPTLARLTPGASQTPLPFTLRQFGWKTAAFYPPAVFFVDADKLRELKTTNFDFEYVKFEYLEAAKRLDQVRAYFDEVKPRRAFIWVHYFEPHEPYEVHAGFDLGARDIDRYASEIAYTDQAVGALIDFVRKTRPSAYVIVTADHGEEFDEHGGRYHGSSLYEEQVRVPLIIAGPGITPRVVGGQVELVDLAPTILGLLDIPIPARLRGDDLGPWLAPTPAPPSRLPPAFAEVENKRMLVWGHDKLQCVMSMGVCSLFDLAHDPGETKDLADAEPGRREVLQARLSEWLDAHTSLEPGPTTSGAEADLLPRAIERGRLGDLGATVGLSSLLADAAVPTALRREAARLLAHLQPDPSTAEALGAAARDPDAEVAAWAAAAALRVGVVAARSRVLEVVTDAKADPILRVRGALALAAAHDAAGVEPLAQALAHCDEDVILCRQVVAALADLGDARAVPALVGTLDAVQNRMEKVVALGKLGGPEAERALREHLREDAYVNVRREAARGLGLLRARDALPDLQHAAAHDEAVVAEAARAAIAALGRARR